MTRPMACCQVGRRRLGRQYRVWPLGCQKVRVSWCAALVSGRAGTYHDAMIVHGWEGADGCGGTWPCRAPCASPAMMPCCHAESCAGAAGMRFLWHLRSCLLKVALHGRCRCHPCVAPRFARAGASDWMRSNGSQLAIPSPGQCEPGQRIILCVLLGAARSLRSGVQDGAVWTPHGLLCVHRVTNIQAHERCKRAPLLAESLCPAVCFCGSIPPDTLVQLRPFTRA